MTQTSSTHKLEINIVVIWFLFSPLILQLFRRLTRISRCRVPWSEMAEGCPPRVILRVQAVFRVVGCVFWWS